MDVWEAKESDVGEVQSEDGFTRIPNRKYDLRLSRANITFILSKYHRSIELLQAHTTQKQRSLTSNAAIKAT
ncbi:hypothetical protein PanWU01x14_030630 [Parasponia andersonii]|uniref:Uncharacterized protein n=1 Tax=Parasponia andersonii TaxID=3476 RepID=A0A2P5DUT5_PARAD|nr:hypothetical protein PanWU01x14_030630 [Parasponia andersonii]